MQLHLSGVAETRPQRTRDLDDALRAEMKVEVQNFRSRKVTRRESDMEVSKSLLDAEARRVFAERRG